MEQFQPKNNRQAINIPLLLLFIIWVMVAGGIYFFQQSVVEEINKTAVSFMVSNPGKNEALADSTVNWKTFRNEILGIEFKYPADLGFPEIIYKDYDAKKEKDYDGKAIEAYFMNSEPKISFAFGAHSSDYAAELFGGFKGNEDIALACANPFSVDKKGKGCKVISVGSQKGILENELLETEKMVGLATRVYFNNLGNKEYLGLEFFTSFSDADSVIRNLYGSVGNDKDEAYREAANQSKNILNETNLSSADKNNLEILYKIISTFRYIK